MYYTHVLLSMQILRIIYTQANNKPSENGECHYNIGPRYQDAMITDNLSDFRKPHVWLKDNWFIDYNN